MQQVYLLNTVSLSAGLLLILILWHGIRAAIFQRLRLGFEFAKHDNTVIIFSDRQPNNRPKSSSLSAGKLAKREQNKRKPHAGGRGKRGSKGHKTGGWKRRARRTVAGDRLRRKRPTSVVHELQIGGTLRAPVVIKIAFVTCNGGGVQLSVAAICHRVGRRRARVKSLRACR